MISGRARQGLGWSLLLALLPAATGWANEDIDELLRSLTREPPQAVAFKEIRRSSLVEGELVISGMLEFLGPGRLSRVVTQPYEERTDIDGDEVRVRRGDRPERRFSLGRSPELRGLLTSFAAMLGGDRATLERNFDLEMTSTDAGWQLLLTPRSSRVRTRLPGIWVRGSGDAPLCIVIGGSDGDAATMLLGDAAAAQGAAQRERYCGARP